MDYTVFVISDGTGITSEALAQGLLSQFSEARIKRTTIPYVSTEVAANACVRRINKAGLEDGRPPLLICSILEPAIRDVVRQANALMIDIFDSYLSQLEGYFGVSAQGRVGLSHAIATDPDYHNRIAAVDYALANDDGARLDNYINADVILIGVSRSGKTPTSLYLALHYGLNAANYPLTDEDLERSSLPKGLQPYREKLFGLSIDPVRLTAIRSERRANSRYASAAQCEFEVRQALGLMNRSGIPHLDATHLSIEELATRIIATKGLERHN